VSSQLCGAQIAAGEDVVQMVNMGISPWVKYNVLPWQKMKDLHI